MLTRKGRATIAAGITLLAGGLVLASPLLLATGTAALLLVAIAAFLLRHVHVELTRDVSARVLEEEQDVTVSLTVHATAGGGRVFAELRDKLPDNVELAGGSNYALLTLKGTEPVDLAYRVACPVKGRIVFGPLRVRVQDAFGFFHRDEDVPGESHVTVYPRAYDLKDALVRSKFPQLMMGDYQVRSPGLGSTFFALREYQVGDSIRSINWKASARSTKLVVNQTERESQARATFLLDARGVAAAGTPRRNGGVWSARAAASIARFILRRRDKVRLFVYGDGILEVDPRGEKQDVVLNEALASAGASGTTTLNDVVTKILPTLRPRSPVVIFSNLLDDPTAEAAIQALRAYEANVVVVSANPVDFLKGAGMKEGDLEFDAIVAERETLLATLKSYGAWVVNWPADEPLSVTLAREATL